MKTLLTLARGDSLNAWELSPIEERYFPGEPAPASDPQNYKYINGFVDVGDLPCRVATWAEVASRTLVLDTNWPVESLYLPGRSRRVEFSRFCARPTRLSRWCRTYISAPEDGYKSFRLSTRGGIHIWVDGLIAARFEPFTRNHTQHTIVHLPIKATGSEVIVFMEEMAERDVSWFFELVLEDDVSLAISLPGAKTGPIDALRTLAAQIRPTREVIDSTGLLTLRIDDPAPIDIAISALITSTSHTHAPLLNRDFTLPAGQTELVICRGDELPDGYHTVFLAFSAGSAQVEREIACAILHEIQPRALPGDLAARKRQALEHAAEFGEMRMGAALALLATARPHDPRLRPIIEQTLLAIEERRDCADFIAVPLLWAFQRYGADFPDDLRQRTIRALLDFRYWVDEPGNDVMWFWSENHALCFHVAQLLAGQLWPDETFTASARKGRQQAALASERLAAWFDAVEEDGLAEWNSAAYYPVDFIGLLALVEFAPAPLAERASALCDRIFTMVALHTLASVPAGSMGRAYDKELRAGPLTELAPFAAVAFGTGWLNTGVASLPMFAAGRYIPPADLTVMAFPPHGKVIEANYRQGYGPAALLSLYKTADLQLSTNCGAKAGAYGHQQHVLDISFAAHPMARAWINHPGEDDPWGQHRPSYWAGNGRLPRVGQHGPLALLLYHLGDDRLDFTHIYAGRSGIEHHVQDDALILRSGHALLAFKATGSIEPISTGPTAGLEYRQHGPMQGWAVIISETNDLDKFITEIAATDLSLDAEGTRLRLQRKQHPEVTLSWMDGLAIAGTRPPMAYGSARPQIRP